MIPDSMSITCASNLFFCTAEARSPYLRASFVKVDASEAPIKKSPSIKYWRNGGLLSLFGLLKSIYCWKKKWKLQFNYDYSLERIRHLNWKSRHWLISSRPINKLLPEIENLYGGSISHWKNTDTHSCPKPGFKLV